MTESSAPRAQTSAHYAPALENITLVITVVGAHFRQNRRNVLLFTFLALNTGYGAINWM